MAVIDLTKSCLDSIRQISEHIEGAVLYIDAGCTECFQLVGAFPLLLELGVRAVCSLESMSSLDVVVNWNSSFDTARKLVVMTSRLLSDAHRYILRCLSTHQVFRVCSIFTSISEVAQSAYPDSPLGPDAFHEYESLLLQDYDELVKKSELKSEDEEWSQLSCGENDILQLETSGKYLFEDKQASHMEDVLQRLVVSVHHFPMLLCPFSPKVFVLPSEGSVAEAYLSVKHVDSLSSGLPPLSTGLTSYVDDFPPGASLTAHFLYHLAAKMDLKLEIFSLGDLSKNVGKILTDMSSLYDVGRRKRSAGLLLIDRTLDLLTPCCHGDSLVDRMFSSLPRRQRTLAHTNLRGSEARLKHGPSCLNRPSLDVQIPLGKILSEEDCKIDSSWLSESIESFLYGWDSSNVASPILNLSNLRSKTPIEMSPIWFELLRGSLDSKESFRGTPYIEAILDRRSKDGAVLVKKWLQEALHRENVTVNMRIRPGFPTKLELQTMIKALAKSQSSLVRNKGIIQLAAGVVLALDEFESVRWDAFSSAEKMLNVSAGDTSQSLAAQIGDLISKSTLVEACRHRSEKVDLPSEGLLSFQDALLLMVVGYILAGENFPTSGSGGPFSWQEERFLKEAIMDAILENSSISKLKFLHGLSEELETNLNRVKWGETKETSSDHIEIDDFDDDQWGKWGEEDEDDSNNDNKEQAYDDVQLKLELRDRVDNLFKFMHKLSSLKRKNIPVKEGTLASESYFLGDPYATKGLLYKLLARVLSKHDVPGLEYHSSTVGRLFKSGFGRFGLGQAKTSLAEQNVILVFVIGGINGVEVCEAQEALSEIGRPDIELILGGTTLLTPNDMVDLLLGDSSHG